MKRSSGDHDIKVQFINDLRSLLANYKATLTAEDYSLCASVCRNAGTPAQTWFHFYIAEEDIDLSA